MKKIKPRLLIIEDDANLTWILQKYLESKGFKPDVVYNGEEGLKKALTNKYHLLIIDLGLPGLGGFDIVNKLRSLQNDTPVIIITSQVSIENEITAYNNGANHFHKKPINYDILEAQIRQLIPTISEKIKINMLDIEIDTDKKIIKRNENIIDLTKTEFDLLLTMIESNGSVFTRDKIIANLMNYNKDIEYGAVDTMISRIRKKLGEHGSQTVLDTVFKEGYRINLEYLKDCKITYL